ncbi:MAG: hypothetical protein D6748_07000 [Calditrichaeota bacterium]|nr:MAG: hypothetical protein D6748_07000 [Calditrichota bacterium]
MLRIKTLSLSLGLFFSLSFVLCVLYGLLTPSSLHMHPFLEAVLPGFRWISIGSFLLGLIESFLWGIYIGMVFTPIYNFFKKQEMKTQKPLQEEL